MYMGKVAILCVQQTPANTDKWLLPFIDNNGHDIKVNDTM